MYYLVYQTQHKINKMIYVGFHVTNDPNDSYLGSGMYLKRAIKKDGPAMFEKTILHSCASYEEMVAKEKEIVTQEFIQREDTYNLRIGGEGGYIGEEFYATIRGKPRDRDLVERAAAKRRGQKRSEKTKQRMSDAKKTSPTAMISVLQNREKATEAVRGRAQTEEHKRKRSAALKGHPVSEATRQKLREAHLGKKKNQALNPSV